MTKRKLQVWHIPQVPGTAFKVDVQDEREARLILDVLAMYDQFQFQHRIKPDFSNVQGVNVQEQNGEWVDYYTDDDNADEFDTYCSNKNINFCKMLVLLNNIKF